MQQDISVHSTAPLASYDVAGFRLRVGVDSPELLDETQALLQAFQVERLTSPAWALSVRYEALTRDDLPGLLRPIWSGLVPPKFRAVNYVGPDLRRMELLEHGRLDLNLRTGEAMITVEPQARARVTRYFLMSLLCVGLARTGHCPVHAACLAVSGRGKPRGVLIVAESGTGKSTTALALTSAGWNLMGDDLSLLCRHNGRLAAWGFPRNCHVRRPTLDLLPWLNDLPLSPASLDGTFDLPVDALGKRAAGPRPQPLEPALVLVLESPNPEEHRCRPLDRATALASLSKENVQPIEGSTDIDAQAAFVAFAELVRQTPAYALSVGPRLDQLADFLAVETGVGA